MKNSEGELNVIREIRKITQYMNEQQKFKKALSHVKDALSYKHPRPDAYTLNINRFFSFAYKVQRSTYWQWTLLIFSYIYMYCIVLEQDKYFVLKTSIEATILVFYWFDMIMYMYHKCYQTIKISFEYDKNFYIKLILIILMSCDLIIVSCSVSVRGRPFKPFRLLRCLLPIYYDSISRKSFQAFISSYKDILVFLMLYAVFIISFSLTAEQFIQLPSGTKYDEYTENYNELTKTIFLLYTLISNYPDNQLIAIEWSQWMMLFFIIFIFFSIFFFFAIPTTIIYNSFRQTRSKILLIDQIRQQHSLILAFVTLGQENYHIKSSTLVRFLLYMYKNKVRYFNLITQICLKLDQNNNGTIQISQFMQLGKILSKNSYMLPPHCDDLKIWIKFRQCLIKYTKLDGIVESWCYNFISNVIIILTFINCIIILNTDIPALRILDNVFEYIFLLDITLKFIGFGPFKYFQNKWNDLDSFIVIMILILELLPSNIVPHNSYVLLKMLRIFRISTVIKLIRIKKSEEYKFEDINSIYYKGKQLLSQSAIIIPIVIKFLPLFLIINYIFGVIGMEIFYQAQKTSPTAQHGMYSNLSNFKTFLASQYLFIQILVDSSGWSIIAFDYAIRTNVFFPVVLYFMIVHAFSVLIVTALLKALVWQAYFTINDQFLEQRKQQQERYFKQKQVKSKKQQILQIKETLENTGNISSDSVLKRSLLESKLNKDMFKRLKYLYYKRPIKKQVCRSRSQIIKRIVIQDKSKLINLCSNTKNNINFQSSLDKIYQKLNKNDHQAYEIDNDEYRIEKQLDQLMENIVLNPNIRYSETMVYPTILIEFLNQKLIKPPLRIRTDFFNIDQDPLQNIQSIKFHIYELNVLLQNQPLENQQRLILFKQIANNQSLPQEQPKQFIFKKETQKNYHFNVNWIIRKMFLHQTNEDLVKKLQIQYFSDIYGKSFKQINKVTIQPLLRYEALLTFNLRNILRYSQIPSNNFFQILTSIQDKMSNQLLRPGSLLKFVYQIQNFADNWFTIDSKESQQAKIHFIKNGIWIYNQKMEENQLYYARDFFDWKINQRQDKITCEKILKLLFQSFQGLACELINQKDFFASNPCQSIYSLFSYFIDVSKDQKIVSNKTLGIQKIMLIILSKQDERPIDQFLPFELTDIIPSRKPKKQINFKFDITEKQTFKKLKNLQVMDYEKIIQNQGLPFAYILNLIQDIKDILNCYHTNFVYQVQKVLNLQFQRNQKQHFNSQ